MKSLSTAVLFLLLAAGVVASAHAECRKDGQKYQTDEVVDGFRCTADGKWVKT